LSQPFLNSEAHGDQKSLRTGYLLSRYPAISHTFFMKEVLGLRERGLRIETASINPPDRAMDKLPPIEADEARRTFYVKSGGMAGMAMRAMAVAVRHPVVTIRGFIEAVRLGGWDLLSRIYLIFYLAEALLVGDWLRKNQLPHLHVHFGGPVATVGMLTSIAWRVPWSITIHGPDEFFDQEAFFLRQKIESASFVICISDFCRSQILRIAPALPDGRLEVVRLGVDCRALQPADRDEPDGNRPVRLVCTGRMVAAKGHRILLEALGRLGELGIEFSCVLIGDGPERKSLEALSGRLGLGSTVEFLGAMAHQPTLEQVARADIFVLASFAEGLPVALMEAMAMGVPCVSTTIAAIPELITDGQNGLLVAPANVEALSEALVRLAGDAPLRHQLGGVARATVESNYNLAHNLDLLANIISARLSRNA
jgi:colanic acid/amylovoran biosynthesis glycosyltransferase